MNQIGPNGMWDEEDGFYYDVLRFPDGSATRLKVRSHGRLVAPLCYNGHRTVAAGASATHHGDLQRAGCDACRQFSIAFIPPGQAIAAWRTEASLRW